MLILFKDLWLIRCFNVDSMFQRWFGRARVATFRDSGQERYQRTDEIHRFAARQS